MTLLQIYEAVCRQRTLSQGRFLLLYRQTLSELLGEYESVYVLISPADFRISDEIGLHADAPHFPEYDASVIHNILFLDNRELTTEKQLSLSERASAYMRVWNKKNRRRKASPRIWE